ncbi:hypothetical protein HNP55_002469 [Paucibacter oligotrophus]|uniref:Amidohydrolase family protein n=1 Tax=Roseateles oligotrophus TaxID=1769250 RepID=A0A840L7C3_9BURK|nr:hypothetical protein [Roseateles oligotrophus]MBB4843946.1 hypothetical protein [Roseateles oligotrophus]
MKVPRILPFSLGLSLLLATVPAAANPEPETPYFKASAALSMELKNAQWFDGKGLQRGTLYVKDGRFTDQRIKKAQRQMDLKGQFLIPPLADAHNHNLQTLWGFARYAPSYLRDGVFYTAQQCGEPKAVAEMRPIAAQAASPEVLFNSACITASEGQPLAQLLGDDPKLRAEDFIDKAVLVMDTLQDLNQKWPLVGPRKSDSIKLMISRSESPELRSEPKQHGRLGLRPELVGAIVKRAHQDGYKVIAQADTAADFALATQSGVDWVARLPGLHFFEGTTAERYRISPEAAAEAAKKKLSVITAISGSKLFPMPAETLAAVRQLQAENLRRLLEAKVPLLLGSDLYNGTALSELRTLDALGLLDRSQLLRLATVDTPRALFPKRKIACFDNGCEASFLLLKSNPLQGLEALERIQLRVKQGRVLSQ